MRASSSRGLGGGLGAADVDEGIVEALDGEASATLTLGAVFTTFVLVQAPSAAKVTATSPIFRSPCLIVACPLRGH